MTIALGNIAQRIFQASAQHECMRGFAHDGAKHALKMERRNASRTCDQRQRQLPGKVDLDVVQRTVHALDHGKGHPFVDRHVRKIRQVAAVTMLYLDPVDNTFSIRAGSVACHSIQ
ncbi:hypothetical protein XEUV354_21790 [Xanthomonas euvesicatoria]|nr:hypothetical protein BHE83_02000 [Xanthomonas euvesicatoria pv. vesicatoria str. 85-10]KHL67590.1 hypothetical protein XEU83M_00340 [Xanthomonas euvesicatoria]KLA49615.1 hypothetical protein XEUV683_21670 [Xanthomonas euvesicatoria]KLA49771.1 hypothetical protein XEUV685_22235 [Xanthomonas euvesicatoria]KLA62781.1 hypothetical protein XEUV689_21885 [Xanthomonas euvesicatoria]